MTFVKGRAEFIGGKEIRVGDKVFRGEKFVIAVGSSLRIPREIEGIEKIDFWYFEKALRAERLPKSVAIIGGGPVGVEFSQMLARFSSKVYLLRGRLYRQTSKVRDHSR